MATDKQKEDGKPRKKCHRRNLQIEEFPTFTKWLGPRGRSSSHDDTSSKSYKRGVPYPPIRRIPRDSSRGGGGVVACDVPKEDGVAIGESISAQGGCCCWQRSKSTQRECGLNFHFSLRKSKVVTNVSEDVAAGVSDVREEQVVEAGAVINREGCRCRCSPTFLICGRRKVPPTGVPYFPEKRSGRRNSRSTRRRCSPVVDAPNLHKEEGPATDGPGVLKEEVATSCPDLVKEGEAIAAPGPCKEGSGSCCSQWKCLPSFPMCGRKLSVVEEEATIEEEVSVDDPNGPEVEEVANGPELVKEGEATVAPALCKEGSESCSQWKCSQSIPMCERKVATGEEELTVVDIPNLLEVEVANGPELVKEGEATDAPAPCKKSGSCCSQWKCLPTFPMCGRKVATGKEELTVVDVPNLLEVEEVANGPELVKEGEATDSPGPCKKRSGSCCSQWKCLPAFPMCGRKVATGKEELTVVDVPNLLEVEEVANGPELVKEGEATDSPGPCKKRSGSCCSQWKCLPAFTMCGRKVATGKEELTVVDVPNLLEVEEVANGPELVKEGEATDSPGPCKKRSGSCCSQWKCLPAFPMCGRKVATGKEELTVVDVPNLLEVEEVANGPELVKEGEATDSPGPCKKRSGSCCSQWKCLPAFPMCGRKVATGKEELTVVDVPNLLEVEEVANGPELVKEGEATDSPGPCKKRSGSCCSQWKCLPAFPMCGRKVATGKEELTVVDVPNLLEVEEVANGPELVKEGEATDSPGPCKKRSGSCCSQWKCLPAFPMCGRKVATGKEELTVDDVPNLPEVEEVANGPGLVKEGEATVAPDPCKKRSGSYCSRWKCLPAFPMCGRKGATGKEELTVVDVPNSPEVEVVANGPELVKEGEATVAPGPCKEESGNCFSQWKCLPSFPMCGRKLSVVEEEVTVDDLNVPEVANRPYLAKEGEATVGPDPRKEGSGCCSPRLKEVSELQIRSSKVAAGKQEMTVDVPNVPEVEEVANDVVNKQDDICPEKQEVKGLLEFQIRSSKVAACKQEMTVHVPNVPEVEEVANDIVKKQDICPEKKEVKGLPEFQVRSSKVAAGKQEMTVDVPNVPEVEVVANDVVNKQDDICPQKKEVVGDPNTGEAVASCGSSSNRNKEEEKINASVPELHKKGSGCCWFKWMPAFLICGSKVVSDVPNPSREEKVVAGDSDIQKEGVGAAAAAAAADADANWEVQSKSARQGSCWPFQCCTIWWPSKLLCTGGMDVNASNHQEEEQEAPLGDNEEKVVDVLTVKHNEKGAAMVVPDLHEEDGTVADEQVAAVDIPVPRKEEEESAGDTPDLIQKEKKVSSGKEEEENVGSVVSDSGKEEGGCCCCLKHGGKEDGCSRRDRDRGRRQSSNSREGCWPFQICGKGWLGLPTFLICGRRKRLSDSISSDGNGVSVSDINVVVAVAGTSSVLAIAGTSGGLATIDSSKSIPMPGCGWYSKPPRRRSVSIDKEEGDSRCSKSSKRRRGWFRRSGRKEKEGKERKR